MTLSQLNRLALRQSRASWRLLEWRALAAALLIAICLSTLLAVTGAKLEKSLGQQSAALLGADLVISSSRPLPDKRAQAASTYGLQSSTVTQLSSMLSGNDKFLLGSIKAVAEPYPLRGEISTAPALGSVPEPGTVWAEKTVLQRLGLNVGDPLTLGYSTLTISAELLSTPDRGRGFGSFNPMVILNQADLAATQLIAPGARIDYRLLIAGPKTQVDQFEQSLLPQLSSAERLVSLNSEGNLQGNLQQNLNRYLRLSAVMALLLCALTILLSLRRFSHASLNRAAVLLNLGLQPGQLVQLFGLQLLQLWLVCAAAGTLIALLLDSLVASLLNSMIPGQLPDATLLHWLQGALMGLVLLTTLGLPPLLAISRVSVSQLLRQSEPASVTTGKVLMGLALLALLVWIGLYLDSPVLALALTAVLVGVSWALGLIGQWLTRRLATLLSGRLKLGRLLVLRIQQQRRWQKLQIPVMSLLLALMALLWLARGDLMERWAEQLPLDSANHFVINIQPWEKDPLAAFMQQQGVEAELYPMVRARITGKNGLANAEAFNAEQKQHNSLNRELNLTWRSQLARGNEVIEGSWPPKTDDNGNTVSVESNVAAHLGLKLGDTLSFSVGANQFEATVDSIRKVKWDSFQPNFYMVFAPAALEKLPTSYITAFYLPPENSTTANGLLEQFPTLTLIAIEQLLAQARQLIEHLVDASSLIMAMSLLAGTILVITLMTQERAQRRYENALLQALGASNRDCQQLDRLEFGLTGLVCGALAALLAELALWPIHQMALKVDPVIHPSSWLILPLLGMALFTLLGSLSRRAPRSLWTQLRAR
ncbi:MAG: hypothetical protein OIF57_17825 [Marinobacterium sp.]|nr:hypothetical protein [Marinobacterium sp.]